MTPKEKAKEILLSYKYILNDARIAKRCALIAVDEIIQVLDPEHWGLEMNIAIDELNYWRDVKKEIESL